MQFNNKQCINNIPYNVSSSINNMKVEETHIILNIYCDNQRMKGSIHTERHTHSYSKTSSA